MKHVMIDIETFGKAPDACIIEIGAVEFDMDGTFGDELDCPIHPQTSLDLGMKLDVDTILWWGSIGGWQLPDKYWTIEGALNKLADTDWNKFEGVWTNAPTFDFVILDNAYKLMGKELPWHYRQQRCARTLLYTALQIIPDIQLPERQTAKHNALHDAIYQAQIVQYLMARLGE